MSGKQRKNNTSNNDLDLNYLKSCFEMTPEQRYHYFEKIMEFFRIGASPQAKENARKLKELGF